MLSAPVIALFAVTLVLFGFAGWLALRVASSADEQYGRTPLTKNQWRALAWALVVVAALVGAVIECRVVLREDEPTESKHPAERRGVSVEIAMERWAD